MLFFYLSLLTEENDKDAIIYIYERYYSHMANAVVQELGDNRFVEDVVHDTMLTFIEIIDRIDYSDKRRLMHLSVMIARRRAIDFKRKTRNNDIPLDEQEAYENAALDSPEDIVISRESREIIWAAFKKLDYKYREVCALRYWHKMSDKDIAGLLGISESAVSMRLYRARKRLAELLKEEKSDV